MNVPVFLTREHFLSVLDDIRAHVEDGDSFEGFIEYTMPWHQDMGDPETDPADGFRVLARYRVGNLQGQGGMRMIGRP